MRDVRINETSKRKALYRVSTQEREEEVLGPDSCPNPQCPVSHSELLAQDLKRSLSHPPSRLWKGRGLPLTVPSQGRASWQGHTGCWRAGLGECPH